MYGTGTRSYNRSTEKRSMDKERAEATARYLAERARVGPRDILLRVCTCRSFTRAHDPARHKELLSELDWRTPQERQYMRVYRERVS